MIIKDFRCERCKVYNKKVPYQKNLNRWGLWAVAMCLKCGLANVDKYGENDFLQPTSSKFTEVYGHSPLLEAKRRIAKEEEKEAKDEWEEQKDDKYSGKQKRILKNFRKKLKEGAYKTDGKRRGDLSKHHVGSKTPDIQ